MSEAAPVGVLALTVAAQTVRMSVPYACAALGGVVSERSGVPNIALEGMLLAGGLGGVAAHLATGSPVAGVLAGVLAGLALGVVHGAVVVHGRVDAIISGIALNLAAAGGTRFLLRALYGSSSNSPAVEGFRAGVLGGAGSAMMLLRALFDPFTLGVAALTLVTWAVLRGTRFGLRLRAAGEAPMAAAAVGVPVARVRLIAVALSGALTGLGGVALAFDQHQFQSGMSGGRGFIALAAVILAGWRPVQAAVAATAFAALDALQIVLQDQRWLPPAVAQMLPYVATLAALTVVARRRRAGEALEGRPPAGLGQGAD